MLRFLILFLCTIISTNSYAKDYAVILHGIGRSSSHMQPLADALTQQGYDVLNLDYPSTEHEILPLAKIVYEQHLQHLDPNRTVHLIGYSMGGLVVRTILHHHKPDNLGRVLLLAAPNHGSEVADWLKDNWLYQWYYGPAGQQLLTDNTVREGLFGDIGVELGVIAGNSSVDPVSSYIIPEEDDGKVSIRSTVVNGMSDHITVHSSHMFFPSNQDVHQQSMYFLQNGEFKRD